jgi:hypothetical protein
MGASSSGCGATPRSAPSCAGSAMAEAERTGRWPRGSGALAFAIAALLAAWNPPAAPFGLGVGIAAAVLAWRAMRGTDRRGVPVAALGVAVLAAGASIAVLALTAGALGVDLPGDPVVKGRTPAELNEVLSKAGEQTHAQRQRAAQELDRLAGPRAPDGGARPRPEGRDGGGGGRGDGVP